MIPNAPSPISIWRVCWRRERWWRKRRFAARRSSPHGAEDLDKFKLLTSQYLRRYHKSFYAGDFIRRFAVVIMTGKYAESTALFQEIAETLETLDKDQQKFVYSAIAEAGIVRGRVQITLLAAKKLADQAKDDPKRAVQARLYESAVLLVTDDYDRAAAQLKSIDRAELGPRDRPLLDAALTVAGRMRAPPPAAASDRAAAGQRRARQGC